MLGLSSCSTLSSSLYNIFVEWELASLQQSLAGPNSAAYCVMVVCFLRSVKGLLAPIPAPVPFAIPRSLLVLERVARWCLS